MPEDALRRPSLRARTLGAVLGATCLVVPLLVAAAPASAVPASAASISSSVAEPQTATGSMDERPRTIITQDGEIDDMDSFVRWLYYSNEFDVEGIIYSSSMFHWRGEDPDAPADIDGVGQCGGGFSGSQSCTEPFRWTGTEWLDEYLDEYEDIYPNLVKHADGYPTPDYLRSIYKIGNVDYSSAMSKDTEGSEWIERILLDDDPRPVYVQTWGGLNTLARALKAIEDDYTSQGDAAFTAVQEKISQKVVIYNILNQDNTLGDYIKPVWPGIQIIDNQSQFWSFAYQWSRRVPEPYRYTLQADWMKENLLDGHGELLAGYHTWGDGQVVDGELPGEDRWSLDKGQFPTSGREQFDFISEGDSPAFMMLLDSNGLRNAEDPTWGGWGGRFAENATGWIDTADFNTFTGAEDRSFPQTRWVEDIQNDFAARADWGIASEYGDANHNPTAAVAEGVDLNLVPGQEYTLNGTATDPDGDGVSLHWWEYADASTYDGEVPLSGADSGSVTFTVPEDAEPGETIHLMLEAEDDGTPSLKHWQRVVVTVVDAYSPVVDEVSTTASTTGVTPVTVTGSELFDVTAVSVGETEAPADVTADGRSLTFTAPASEIAGAVSASLVGGEGASFELEYAAPTVTSVAPARGPAAGDQEVVLTGTDLALAEEVLFGDASGSDVSASADALTVTTPESADGATDVTVVLPGVDVVLQDAYVFTTVDVAVSSDSVRVGDELNVSATGFGAGEEVEIRLHSDPVRLANATADAAGVVEVPVTIPVGTEIGDHEIVAQGVESGTGAASITVTSPSGTGGGSGDDDLATTGGDAPWGIALGGLALLILGAGAFVLRRRSGLSAG